MTLPRPFVYPTSRHSRRHGPTGYQNYERFKDWLRDEFRFRCVYCLFRERWYPDGHMSFSVEHVIPRSADRGGSSERDYNNLLYACNRCNSFRGVAGVLNPTRSSLGQHLEVREEDGSIRGRTAEGRKSIRILRLDDPDVRHQRRRFLVELDLKRENPDNPAIHGLFVQTFGYPDDLPDLRRLRPPRGNLKPGSEEDCYYAVRERGELEEIY
jgi:HNH endonuclease